MPPDELDDPQPYEVRWSEPAEAERDRVYLSRMAFGLASADRWLNGLAEALDQAARMPRMWPLDVESRRSVEVRRMLYGRRRDQYVVLYVVVDPTDGDPGIVRVVSIRHSARDAPSS